MDTQKLALHLGVLRHVMQGVVDCVIQVLEESIVGMFDRR